MSKYLGETSVPGVVALLGEYGLGYNEPALAVGIDHRLSVKANETDFDFYIVDDYKMEQNKHKIIHSAVDRFWEGAPLEFITSSELPLISGFGTESALSMATVGLLTELNILSNPELKLSKNHGSVIEKLRDIITKSFELNKMLNELNTPLRTAGAAFGGAIYIDTEPKDALCSIPNKSQNLLKKTKKPQSWNVHELSINDDLGLIIGYPKQKLEFSKFQPKPLFEKPDKKSTTTAGTESIPQKLHRLVLRSGLAKDNIKEIGNLARSGCKALIEGNYQELGELMDKEQNLITMLGLCPQEVRPIIDVAKEKSYGVRLTGYAGDAVLAISADPEEVVNDIKTAGFDAIFVHITHQGYKANVEK